MSKIGGGLQLFWALNTVCCRWKALIYGDYLAVMPLPVYRNFFLTRIHLPPDYHTLGIYACRKEDETVLFQYFLDNLSRLGARYISYVFVNEFVLPATFQNGFKTTYILSLQPNYGLLRKGYSHGLRHTLNRFKRSGLVIQTRTEVVGLMALRTELAVSCLPIFLSYQQQKRHIRLMECALERRRGELYEVYHNEKLISAGFFLLSEGQHQFFLLSNSPKSREYGCAAAIIDWFIQKHAGENAMLDFYGSNVPGIAAFLSSYGGEKVLRPQLLINSLPWVLKLLKRHQILQKVRHWWQLFK